MKYNEKTQKKLIKELTQLRRRIAELEAAGHKRNQFEEALRIERDKVQHYLEIAEVMLMALNKKGEITLINRKGNQILGYKEKELLGKNWFTTCVPSRLRKRTKGTFLKLMAGEMKLTEFYENPVLTKSGTERIMAWHNTLLKDAQGNTVGTLGSGEDITERKQAEEALHKSEEKYRNILQNMQEGYYEVDLAGNFTFLNDAMSRIWGYPKEELMGMNNRQYTDKETAKRLFQAFNKVYKTGKVSKIYDYEIIKKDGTRSYVEASISLRKDSSGRAIGFRGIIRDITDRKQAEAQIERALRETRVRFEISQALASSQTENDVLDVLIKHAGLYPPVHATIFILDRSGNELSLVLRRDSPAESGVATLVPIGTHIPASRYPLINFLSDDQPFISDDVFADERVDPTSREVTRQSGAKSLAAFQLTAGNEQMGYIICLAKLPNYFDEEKQHLYQTLAEQGAVALRAARLRHQIRESQQRFQGLVETLSDWIWEVDDKGVYTYVSPRIQELLGYKPEEIVGKTPFDLMPPDEAERVKGIFESSVIAHQPIVALENTCRHIDGRLVVFETSGLPFFDAAGQFRGYRGIDRDITDRKRAEEELHQKSQELSWVNEQLEFILGATKTGVDIIDADFNLLYIDHQWQQVYGDPTGRKCYEYYMGRDNPCPNCGIPKALETKQTIVTEEVLPRENNRIIEVHTIPFQEADGRWRVAEFNLDITERKRSEELINIRLRLLEFAARHSLAELLQKTLDEVCEFTGSSVGFYHFVAEDQKTLSLQAWSTRTIEEFCKAEGAGMHYSIDQAGVWVDCIRERRPVIHNDYASLLHRKGMPEGHATIVRELVVPIMRHDRFVAILGIGNKPQNYSDQDVQAVSYLADVAWEIAERNRAEEAQRKSEQKYRTILESMEEGYYELDLRGNFTFCNEALAKIHGRTLDEMTGLNNREYMTPENAKRVYTIFNRVYRTGIPAVGVTNEIIKKDGSIVWLEDSVSLLHNAAGEPIGFFGISRNRTEQKKAEIALRESEEKHRDLVENISDIIYATDKQGIITYIAPAIEAYSGYSISEIIGRPFADFVFAEDIPYIMKMFRQDITGNAEPHEYRMLTKSGDIRWVRTSSRPLFKENRFIGLRGILTDITDRKQTEEALKESEEQFRNLAEQSPNMIYINLKGRVVYANKKGAELTGYTREEFYAPDFNFMSLIAPESRDLIKEVYGKHMQGEEVPPYEYTLITKEGKKFQAINATKLILYGGKQALLGVITDITERKKAEEELQRSYQQVQEMLSTTVNALAATIEMKDQYTAGHQPRVTRLACAIAEEMGLTKDQIDGIRMAASIHDIGKIVVPAEILNKPGPLTEIQYEMIKMHPQAGYDILKGIKFPWPVARIILQHHEMMDGSGYPQGLSGEQIMLEARVLMVANVVEAMNAHRPYRPAYDIQEALAEIAKNSGRLYDAAAVDACLRLFTEKGFTFDAAR